MKLSTLFTQTLLLLFCFLEQISSQTVLTVKYIDENEQMFSVPEDGKLYFESGYLLIDEGDGVFTGIKIAEIRKITFLSSVPNTEENTQGNKSYYIYPNPAHNSVWLQGGNDEKITVSIFSINGQLLLQKELKQNEELDIGHLLPGLYLVKANDQTFKLSKL